MAQAEPFRIAYVGGGSRFVVTLLHGLAAQAEALEALGRPVELALLDPDADRAGEMARYADVTARQTGLPIAPAVTANLPRAIDGADWVVLSAGVHERERAARERFGRDLAPDTHEETGARTAIAAAAVWPLVREIAGRMLRSAPAAVFSTLVNPTDVTAAAAEAAFGIPSVGICVEVPGLVGFLSYYLRESAEAIRLEHLGVNHAGWVSRWTVGGEDGDAIFRERMPARLEADDWYPVSWPLVEIHQAVGCLRSSAYHCWPFVRPWTDACEAQARRWHAACLGDWPTKGDYRRAKLAAALAGGRMIPEPDGRAVHPEATPYTYPDARHTLGALAVGLAGGEAGPVPLQVRNGRSNPSMPAEAWLEVPAAVRAGGLLPQPVPPLPGWLAAQTRLLAVQRRLLADWLATGERSALAEGLLALPDVVPAGVLRDLARELAGAPGLAPGASL